MINIIVVFRKIEDARNIRNVLVRNGFTVTAVCSTGLQAISQADNLKGGIVICGSHLTDMPWSELRQGLSSDFQLLLMAKSSVLPSLRDNDIVCLPLPVKVGDLVETVGMMARTLERQMRRRKMKPRARSESDEAAIREAKQVLMERNNMTEPEAHRYLQKHAMDTGTSLEEMARMALELYR